MIDRLTSKKQKINYGPPDFCPLHPLRLTFLIMIEEQLIPAHSERPSVITTRSLVFGALFATVNSSANMVSSYLCYLFFSFLFANPFFSRHFISFRFVATRSNFCLNTFIFSSSSPLSLSHTSTSTSATREDFLSTGSLLYLTLCSHDFLPSVDLVILPVSSGWHRRQASHHKSMPS